MQDQAAQLRELVRAAVGVDPALRPGPPIVVFSGALRDDDAAKLTSDAADELARLGKRVVIVDADPAEPQQAAIAGVAATGALANVLSGARCAVEQLTRLSDHVELLASRPIDAEQPMGGEAVARLLAELAAQDNRVDVVLIDAGCGMTPWVERLWRRAQQVVLVCGDQPCCITAAYSAVKMAHSPALEGKLRMAVRCDKEASAAAIAERFRDTCQRFLSLPLRDHAWIASVAAAASTPEAAHSSDARYRRSVRLLAAELAADVRAVALRQINREPRPSSSAAATGVASEERLDAPRTAMAAAD